MQISLNPGEILYEQGDSNQSAFLISEGTVGLYRLNGGSRVLIEKRGKGAMVGDTAILLGEPRAVTVKAETHCKLFEIPARRILERMGSLDPVLLACVTSTLGFMQAFHGRGQLAGTAIATREHAMSRAIDRLQFENDLADGLRRDEFQVVYQPIIDSRNNLIAGFEALMRWNHPERGLIQPDRFISLAEDLNTIWSITEIALTNACRVLRDCRAACQRPLFASVNISAHDLGRPQLIDFLNCVLDQNDLTPEDIRLELTESALVPGTAIAETNLERLRKRGFGLSIDDFGTGYSNLGHLQLLPIKTLKIDRSFAHGVHSSKVARSIVRMLIKLGLELNADVVAEGVDDVRDVNVLKALDCRFFQGFHFHKPMEPSAFLELVTREAEEVA